MPAPTVRTTSRARVVFVGLAFHRRLNEIVPLIPPEPRTSSARLAWLLGLVLGVAALAACGLGLDDDTGKPAPGAWWPFVCLDGGDVDAEGGCALPPCPDGGSDADANGGCE
jgi:hypothetical protein